MTDHTVTVTGVAVDDKGKIYCSTAYYNGESFFSYIFTESDVAERSVPNNSATIYKKAAWFTNLWRARSGNLYVCDGDGKIHIGAYSGSDWTIVAVSSQTLTTVWGFDDDNVYAAGSEGIIFRRAGAVWEPFSAALGNTIQGIAGSSPDDLYVTGDSGLFWHFDGKNWDRIELPTNANLVGILPMSGADVLISGNEGALFRGSGNEWSDVSQPGKDFYELAVFRKEIHIGGGGAGVFVFDGTAVRNIKDTFPVYSMNANYGYLVVAGGNEACRFEGDGWSGPTYA